MIAVMQFNGDWGVEASEAIRVTETFMEVNYFVNMSKELHIK